MSPASGSVDRSPDGGGELVRDGGYGLRAQLTNMVRTDFDSDRAYDDERFAAQTIFESPRMKTVLGYFEPGQFIPVHAPDSDVTIAVQSGTAVVREGDEEHEVEPGDAVVIEAGTERGVRAVGDERLEALLVTAPPPTDAEHDPVRKGIREGVFDPGVE